MYQYAVNMEKSYGKTGFVGFGIRQLSTEEVYEYCVKNSQKLNFDENSIKLTEPIKHKDYTVKFSSNFYIRTFSAGCYYLRLVDGQWSSEGLEIYPDTDLTTAHCETDHLTEFAAGLLVLPSDVNFALVFEDPSFTKNPIIYSVLIVTIFVYVVFAICARIWDKIDLKKVGVTPLRDNKEEDKYFYEVVVFTGNRMNSGTKSNVNQFNFILILISF
jgi:hypothetical protein